LPTHFASAERLSPEEIQREVAAMRSASQLRSVLDSIPNIVVVLNAERQILAGNNACDALAHSLRLDSPIGLRLGEFLTCRRAMCAEFGCGTTEGCHTCGAIRAILGAASGRRASEECRIGTKDATAYDFRVTASPFPWEGGNYLLVVVGDISAEKRREALEHIFFHDVLNTAGGISGIAAIIADQPSLCYNLKDDLLFSAESLVNEIRAQRLLLAAEKNELVLQLSTVSAQDLLDHVRQLYRNRPIYGDRLVQIEAAGIDITLHTDPTILQRVLANMVKNALEATPEGTSVRLGADATQDEVIFWCHNEGVIAVDDALQIFQRSFSTKGSDRGLGTYSMKLLGERYLRGHVSFTSTAEQGTRFEIRFRRKQCSL
jgi:signal transduction histidine kinase